MEHLIGIKVKDKIIGELGFITWGRIFHPVDESELLQVIEEHLPKFGIRDAYSVELCYTLQDVSRHLYFYEAIFEFSQKLIPDGKKYKIWQTKMAENMRRGEEIYFLGLSTEQKLKATNLGGTISHGFFYS